jgi:hypothetical protein
MSGAQRAKVIGTLPQRGQRDRQSGVEPRSAPSGSSCSSNHAKSRFSARTRPVIDAERNCAGSNKDPSARSDPQNDGWNSTRCRRLRNAQRIGIRTDYNARRGAAWADTPDAAATRAHGPRAMPSRSGKIVCRSAARRRQNLCLPCRQRATIVAGLLRCAGAGEPIDFSRRRPCRPAAKPRSSA